MDRDATLEGQVATAATQEERIKALTQRAWEVGARDPRYALSLSQEAYELARQGSLNDSETLLPSLINLGRFHYELSELDRAQAYLDEALLLVQGEQDEPARPQRAKSVSRIYMGMGLIRWRLGDYAAALQRMLIALDIIRKAGDKAAEATLLSNIGMVYGVIGEHRHAMNVYQQVLALYEAHHEPHGYGLALNNMAMVCVQAAEYAQALTYALSSLEIAVEVEDRGLQTNALDSAGAAYLGLGRLDEAFDHFARSAALAAELGDRHDELAAWIHIGQLYARKDDIAEAQNALQRAMTLAQELDDTEQIRLCHRELAELFKSQGEFEQALAHYAHYHEHDRAIYLERADMRFKTLQVMHETQATQQAMEAAEQRSAALEKEIEGRRRVVAALRESEERFRLLMEESPFGVHIYAADGALLHCNRAWRDVWTAEGVDWDSYNILTGRSIDLLGVRATVERAFQGESVQIPAVELNPQQLGWGSHTRWLRGHAYSILDEEGQLKNVILLIEDITEQRRSDEIVRQAQKMESLGVLAGGVAHDFNNLLVAMLGQASLALNLLPAGHQARGHVQKVVLAAQEAAELTQQMLAYSGRGHFAIKPLDLNALISENSSLWQAAVSHRVSLNLDLMAALPPIEADASQIRQMIMNLLLNAAEAGEQKGKVTVTTLTRELTDGGSESCHVTGTPLQPGRYVSLKVMDQAGGIPAAYLSHIFDPFFTTKEAGRGLGLAAVLGIVQGHKAGLAVCNWCAGESAGAVFEILFPVSELPQTAPLGAPTDNDGGRAVQGSVLVIDDEFMVREAVTDILTLENIQVLEASDGEEGVALYRRHAGEIDLVLLDLSMPGMNGEETFRRIRELDPQARVLLSSGYNADDVTIHFDENGPAGFLQKPYSLSALLDTVRKHLQA